MMTLREIEMLRHREHKEHGENKGIATDDAPICTDERHFNCLFYPCKSDFGELSRAVPHLWQIMSWFSLLFLRPAVREQVLDPRAAAPYGRTARENTRTARENGCTAHSYGCTRTLYRCIARTYGCMRSLYRCIRRGYGCTRTLYGRTAREYRLTARSDGRQMAFGTDESRNWTSVNPAPILASWNSNVIPPRISESAEHHTASRARVGDCQDGRLHHAYWNRRLPGRLSVVGRNVLVRSTRLADHR